MWYKFDVHKFGRQMLPTILHKPLILAFVRALLAPLVWLYNRFRALQEECHARLSSSGLSLSLAEALRRAYNTHEGDIYIVDAEDKDTHLYKLEEQRALHLYKASEAQPSHYLYYRDEGRVTPDYYIHIPDYLQGEHEHILRLIEQYKPAGRKYEIIYYPYE